MYFAATITDCPEGLTIAQFPVTIAALDIPSRIANGKFHGAMMTATPRGE